jgi:hypothetical protein
VAVARWFDTYRLTERVPGIPKLPSGETGRLTETLRRNDVQAVLHELLAARLTDAPEADVDRVRTTFGLTLGAATASVAQVAPALFDYYDGEICDLVGRLEGTEPDVLGQIRSEAAAARMIAILHAIERHMEALTTRADPRAEADFLDGYRQHVTEHHGKIVPPDFERRRRVPIADLYVPPTIVQMAEADPGAPPRTIDLWTLADGIDRTVLLGDPGGGKTTAANAVMNYYAADRKRLIPFLVTLREFASSDPPERSVTGHIEHRLETFYQCRVPPGIVMRLLLTGRALVIFDGLDELLDTSRRAEVTGIIEQFATEYPLARLLVTSRLVGYDQARLDDRQFARYRVEGFTDDQVRNYVHKWFAQEEGIEASECERWASAFIEESAASQDLTANPLMLALMCILYRGEGSLPRNRTEVYEQCANLLFRKWDARRRIHLELRAGHLLEPTLRHLAWWLFTRDEARAAVTERELIDEATDFLHGPGFESEHEAREAAEEFVGFCRGRMWVFSDVGTTASGEALYSFTHRTFLEYFAAAQLAYKCDTPEKLALSLAPHIARNEWEVLGELAVLIKDHASHQGAQRIYTTLINERRRRSVSGRSGVLQFLARCLRSVDPSPQTVRLLTRQILDHLFTGDTNEKDRYFPLSWLAASCTNSQEIVSDEVAKRIDLLVGSADNEARLTALSLAFWLPSEIWITNANGSGSTSGSQTAKFWEDRTREIIHSYADTIMSTIQTDTEMRYAAYQNGFISTDEAIEMPGGLLALVQVQPTRVFGISCAPHLLSLVSKLTYNKIASTEVGDLTRAGHYLKRHPRPPWVNGKAYPFSNMIREGAPSPYNLPEPLDPVTYLGAAAILLIALESEENAMLRDVATQELGPLNELRPYIRQPWDPNSAAQLPDLPVPPSFQQTFRDWAQGKISFVGISSRG